MHRWKIDELTTVVILFFSHFVMVMTSDVSPSVIIVGAGAAGIAAASRLLENNITNIKILEAEGRIGGRIHSVQFGDAVVDLGAQWCHGNNNIVYQLVKDFDVLEISDSSQTFYHSSRKEIDQEFAEELFVLFGKIYYGDGQEGISAGEYLIDRYNKKITELYSNNLQKLKFASDFLNVLKSEVLLSDGTFSWFDSTSRDDHQESDDDEDFNWKGRGFKTLLEILMKKYPNLADQLPIDDKIILNKTVTKITWDDSNEYGASVQCSDNFVYKADHVILTVSLGVLKYHYNSLFQPQLPQDKINAIQELGIGAVAKFFFHFSQRWWPTENFKSISFFWGEEDKLDFLQTSDINQAWLIDLVGLFPVEKNPNVLEVWFAGEFVPQIELLLEDKIVDGVMLTLNKFVGNQFQNITKQDSVLRFNWYSHPHFRGTYSYQTVKSRKREISGEVTLSKPLTASNGKQTLLFAGEATSPSHYASVHGAVETGFREADRIISFYK